MTTRRVRRGPGTAAGRALLPLPCALCFEPDAANHAILMRIVGLEAYRKLQAAFGGKRVWIPKPGGGRPCRACKRPDRCILSKRWPWGLQSGPCRACAKRDRCIRRWRRSGARPSLIAALLGLSPKSVNRILRGDS